MKKTKYRVSLFCTLLCYTILSTNTQALSSAEMHVSSQGSVTYVSIIPFTIGRTIYQNWRYSPELRTTISDLWIGHWDALDEAVAAKAIRPDFKAFLYCNTMLRYATGANDPPGTFDLFKNNGWLLKDVNGNYVTELSGNSYFVDVGNPAVQQWYAAWLKGYIDRNNLDGVQLDNTCVDTEMFYFATTYNVINPRTGARWTSDEVVEAYISFINTVKQTLGSSKYVIGNGIYNGNHFYRVGKHERILRLLSESQIDGVISEGWLSSCESADWYPEDSWLESINFNVWMEDNFLSKGNRIFMTISENAGLHYPVNQVVLPSGVTKEQYATYCYASRLLAAKNNGNYVNFGYYMPEDYPQSLFKIDLGNPLAAYYKIEGTHVYARDFSKVKVLVNPTNDSYSVTLNGNYETQGGVKTTSSLAVASHTGIILKKL